MKLGRCSFLCGLLVNPLCAAYGDEGSGLTPPEIVRVENVFNNLDEGEKIIIVGNDNGRYVLSCNTKASGCMTPLPGIEYFVFKKDTRWKLPEATEFMTLEFMQNWTESYNNTENIGLFPKNSGQLKFGVYLFESWTAKSRQKH